MITYALPLAAGTNGSVVVDRCQVCGSSELVPVFFAGFLPPVNTMPLIGTPPEEAPSYPAQVLSCRRCSLVQLGLIVDPGILFPPSYAYTTSTTRALRENFAELHEELRARFAPVAGDLIVDIGSNDGTLLKNFQAGGLRVLGIEPTDAALLALEADVPTQQRFFDAAAADAAVREHGPARYVTATNVFAHMENIGEPVAAIISMLAPDGLFISESHYWPTLLEDVQYDTVYHEHLRYYSLTSLRYLLRAHGLEVVHARRIPTHGGSIRVYAARPGARDVLPTVAAILAEEERALTDEALERFRARVTRSKLDLYAILRDAKARGARAYGVGAASRATTLVQYVGLDERLVECVVEIQGSKKIGRYMPGTLIPVHDEQKLIDDQPELALLLSWHLADDLIAKLAARGFRGDFIVPLPTARIERNPRRSA